MKRVVLSVFIFSILTLSSCIRDNFGGRRNGGEVRPVRISFNPTMSDHESTRASYDEVYEDFGTFFGTMEDHFEAVAPNAQYPEGLDAGYGRAADRKISSFRVLIYHPEDGTANHGKLVKMGTRFWNIEMELDDEKPYTIEVATGTYNFVFIANEGTLSDVLDMENNVDLDGNILQTSKIATLTSLRELAFTFGKTKDIHSDNDIPMVAYYANVTIDADNTASYPGDTPGTPEVINGTWEVLMERTAIRLSFGIHMGSAQYDAWTTYHSAAPDANHGSAPLLYIDGLRSEGYLLPKANDGKTVIPTEKLPATTTAVTPGKIMRNTDPGDEYPDGSYYVFFDRMIYPELDLTGSNTDAAAKSKAVKAYLRFDYGGEAIQRDLYVHAPDPEGANSSVGYSLPRNTWVWVSATVLTDVDYSVKVVSWGGASLSLTDIAQYNLTTDRSEFLFRSEGGVERLDITTDHPDGWVISDKEPSANGEEPTAYTIPSWILSPDVADSGATGVTIPTLVELEANNTGKVRTGHFTIRAGNLYKKIVITQLPESGMVEDSDQISILMYVGAYWKAEQYGERLISIKRPAGAESVIDGAWAAYVIEGDDWIILDTEASTRTGEGNDSGFDAAHRVGGYATSVSGDVSAEGDEIYFRVGLNGQYTPTPAKPARYGMILLAYGGNGADPTTGLTTYEYRRIWVRQGENDDYLFNPDEGTGNSSLTARPRARKFSPYNLTATEFKLNTVGGQEPSALLTPGGGAFTNYPSQAGAHFQYAPRYGLYAFNPSYPDVPATWNNHPNQQWQYSWASANGAYETCPEGYRRFTDGDNTRNPGAVGEDETVALADSELAQSLYWKPEGGGDLTNSDLSNSVVGCYADGYFDRKDLINGVSVTPDNYNVAVAGRLYFNPASNASLFFPVGGVRDNDYVTYGPSVGKPRWVAAIGAYWSSSTVLSLNTEDPGAWYLRIDGTKADRRNAANGGYGFSIRCVRDDDPAPGESVFTPQDVVFEYAGGTQTVDIISTNADGFALKWKVTGYDADDNGSFSMDEKPLWITMPENGTGTPLPAEQVSITARPGVRTITPANVDDALKNNPRGTNSDAGRHDLSRDYNGNVNTANSYIVNGSGYYKLPLVYGNAIQDGDDTEEAYRGPGTSGTLGWFVNHADQPFGPGSARIQGADNATLIWMDAPGLVANVSLTSARDALIFDIPEETISQGNAIVAVRDASGTILWSWHIWITHLVSPTEAGQAAQNKSVIGSQGHIYKLMDHNLGWVEGRTENYLARSVKVQITQAETGEVETFTVTQTPKTIYTRGNNPHYMWGRKDALRPSNGGFNPAGTSYWDGGANRVVFWGEGYEQFDTGFATQTYITLGTSIQTPYLIYCTNGNWLTTPYRNLWDSGNTDVEKAPGAESIKSIYDPSPVGFRVPSTDVFASLTTANSTWTNWSTAPVTSQAGRTFTLTDGGSLYMPASGSRFYSTYDGFQFIGTAGNYYANTASSNQQDGFVFKFNGESVIGISSMSERQGNSHSIRPVADAAPIAPPPPPIPEPENLVMAAPGMVGIKKSAYDWLTQQRAGAKGANWIPRTEADWKPYTDAKGHPLTIKGSSTYAGTWVETNIANGGKTDEFTANGYGGLETEPVYTVYFKWGSMIAMIGGGSTSTGGDTWSINDVVWVNPEFDPATITASTDEGDPGYYGSFTPAPTDGGPYTASPGQRDFGTLNPALGHGDICEKITDGTWRIPTGRPFATTETYMGVNNTTGTTYPFGDYRNTTYQNWWTTRGTYGAVTYWRDASSNTAGTMSGVYTVADHVSIGLSGTQGQAVSDNQDLFIPAAGNRNTNGSVVNQGTLGYYRSSSANSSTSGYNLNFYSSRVNPSNDTSYASGYGVRCVQAAPPPPPERKNMIMAAPGMPGIKKSAYDWLTQQRAGAKGANWIPRTAADWKPYTDVKGHPLTIKGSSTYAGTWIDTRIANGTSGNGTDEFTSSGYGGLETEPVYSLYFKWGSMVAMIGGATSSVFSDDWSIDDVVWVNPGFTGTITGDTGTASSDGAYGNFSAAPSDDIWDTPGLNNFNFGAEDTARANGWGDICEEITGGEWRIPTGRPFKMVRTYSGTTRPFGNLTMDATYEWADARSNGAVTWWSDDSGSSSNHVPIGDYGRSGDHGQVFSSNRDLFLPAAGKRAAPSGSMFNADGDGNYWSSTARNTTKGSYLSFSSGRVGPSMYDDYAAGMTIRCVRDTEPGVQNDPISGTFAGSNIYWDGSKLTFDAPGASARPQTQGVYFRWGSLVGISPAPFAAPASSPRAYIPTYNSSNKAASTWDGSSNMADSRVSSVGGTWPGGSMWAYQYSIGENAAMTDTDTDRNARRGDICKYLGDTGAGPAGYRMPTPAELGGAFTATGVWSNIGEAAVNQSGTALISTGVTNAAGVFFPASGFRGSGGNVGNSTAGTSTSGNEPGMTGVYWSNMSGPGMSTSGTGQALRSFSNGTNNSIYNQPRDMTATIRCIKD